MPIKYIFSDVDSTLIYNSGPISDKNKEFINRAKEKGTHFIICSGRLPANTPMLTKQLDIIGKKNEYLVCGNGSAIVDCSLELLWKRPLDKEDFLGFLDYLKQINIKHAIFVTIDTYYGLNTSDSPATTSPLLVNVSFDEAREIIKEKDVYKFGFVCTDDNQAKMIEDKINNDFKGLSFVYSAVLQMEVINAKASKGNAIIETCKLLGIDIHDTLAIGDSNNDASMLKVAGLSACPSNATDEIKELCDYVSPFACYEDAVADIIDKLVLNDASSYKKAYDYYYCSLCGDMVKNRTDIMQTLPAYGCGGIAKEHHEWVEVSYEDFVKL